MNRRTVDNDQRVFSKGHPSEPDGSGRAFLAFPVYFKLIDPKVCEDSGIFVQGRSCPALKHQMSGNAGHIERLVGSGLPVNVRDVSRQMRLSPAKQGGRQPPRNTSPACGGCLRGCLGRHSPSGLPFDPNIASGRHAITRFPLGMAPGIAPPCGSGWSRPSGGVILDLLRLFPAFRPVLWIQMTPAANARNTGIWKPVSILIQAPAPSGRFRDSPPGRGRPQNRKDPREILPSPGTEGAVSG